MICTLSLEGKKVGITANSHKVIRNILDEVLRAAPELGASIDCMQKVSDLEPNSNHLQFTTDNATFLREWARMPKSVERPHGFGHDPTRSNVSIRLFIDEAAQMSLANVLAVSQSAKNLVLLGDPQQLEQPMQGSHPEGTDVSALSHILGTHATIPPDRGLFLDETWRLHPEICTFTSELFYDDRLQSRPGLELQQIRSNSRINGSGLRYLPIVHEGNQNSSPEEADAIRDLVAEILNAKATWINREDKERPIGLNDILIIAPYNAQVSELQERIPGGRIGTVDKFQGQEAPIVIYSITTSSYLDAPRGMEFLYSSQPAECGDVSRQGTLCIGRIAANL